MNPKSLQSEILRLLEQNPKGLSDFTLTKILYPPGKTSHEQLIDGTVAVRKALRTLKSQHRVWPINGLWIITSKGKKSHG